MLSQTKIATCCYCGTRAALVLTPDRHELCCSACGAPLHNLKKLPSDQVGSGKPAKPRKLPKKTDAYGAQHKGKPSKKKRKKGFAQKFFEEAFDLVEDIFD